MSSRFGYGKTNRRQRLRAAFCNPSGYRPIWPPLAAGRTHGSFTLSSTLAFGVAPGVHGHSVMVRPTGLVEIAGRSREHVIRLAAEFFAIVAKDRMSFTASVMIARPAERATATPTSSWSLLGSCRLSGAPSTCSAQPSPASAPVFCERAS